MVTLRWLSLVAFVTLTACKGGGSGDDDPSTSDDGGDSIHSTVPWSQVETTMPECCSIVNPNFEWTVGSLTYSRAEYAMPPDPIGAVVVLHGTNGGIVSVQQVEWLQLYNVLYPRGIGILITQSIDRDAKVWSLDDSPDNADIDHIEELLALVADETDFEIDDPLVTVGFSNGAAFSLLLSSTLAERGRNVKGAVQHNGGQGTPAAGIPGLWLTGENDVIGGGPDNLASYAAASSPGSGHFAGYEVPMDRYRIAKLPSFTKDESSQLFDYVVDELGWWDADGVRQLELGDDPDDLCDEITPQLRVSNDVDAMQQIRVAWATHRMSSQYKLEEAEWIETQLLR